MSANASTAAAPPPPAMRPAAASRLRPATGAGVVLAVLLGALPAAVVGLESAWLVVIAGLACLFMAPALARRQVHALEVVDAPPSLRVHAGRTTPITLEFHTAQEARGLLLDVNVEGSRRSREGSPRLAVPRLAQDASTRLALPVRFGARGHHDAAVLRITSSFPFSMARAARMIRLPMRVTVLPRLLAAAERDLIERFVRTTLTGDATDRAARLRTAGLPVGLRHARPGDRARDVDARATLRKGRWIAFDRSALRDDREIAVGVALRVCGRASSSHRRSLLAFEAAVAHCASAVELLVRTHGAVTLEEVLPTQDALDARVHAALEPGAVVARSSRATSAPLLDRLAAVQLDAAHIQDRAVSPAKSGAARRKGTSRRIVFVPLSPLEFQRASETPLPTRGGQRDLDTTWVIGVDGSGRSILLGPEAGGDA